MNLRNLVTGEAQNEREQTIRGRGFYPESMQRHLMAILKTGDRSDEVATIIAPTLVLHGADDGLVPLSMASTPHPSLPDRASC